MPYGRRDDVLELVIDLAGMFDVIEDEVARIGLHDDSPKLENLTTEPRNSIAYVLDL